MEQWRMLSAKEGISVGTGIIDESITGAERICDVPESIFYSEFSEADAKDYHDIFRDFAEIYEINPDIALQSLESNITRKNHAPESTFCPIELILYSSRYINNIIDEDARVFNKLKTIIAKLLKTASPKIAWYILAGWDWKIQIGIFLEAIGISAPNLIDIAMEQYSRIANLCIDTDKKLLQSYTNMLLATQDKSFAPKFYTVVSNPVFMNDSSLVEHFCTAVQRNPYWKDESVAEHMLENFDDIPMLPELQKKITTMKRKLFRSRNNAGRSIHEIINSNYRTDADKEQAINGITFSAMSIYDDLYEWELIRDPRYFAVIDRKCMENIDRIENITLRGWAYVLLGTHGQDNRSPQFHRENVLDFLYMRLDNDPKFRLPISIALYHMKQITADALFSILFTEQLSLASCKNLGKYFRYDDSPLLSDFIPYVSRIANNPDTSDPRLASIIDIVQKVLAAYNGNDNKLANNRNIPERMIDSFLRPVSLISNNGTMSCSYLIQFAEWLHSVKSTNRQSILEILDTIKENARANNMPSVEAQVNEVFKRMDGISRPS